ncbi:MAG: cell wall-binding repeat-containing protein, partial [Peptostreptococcus sp.]|nr:cell wall-binding repeat-containing protein [Peptostreptococcus sp.]
MSYFDIFKKRIEEKKEKGLKKHSFGTRKLAVGLVSCILGFNLVFSPFVANAETDPEFFGDDDIDKVAIVNKKQTILEASQIVEIEVVPTYYGEWIKVDDRELNLMGLSFNKVNGKYLITGKYNLREAWGQDEEQKRIVETINVIRQDGSVETRKLVFIVQRDTDRDGIPDLTDLDDDNDGYTDVEERAKGSNPKDASSVPPIVISPIDDKTVIEGKPIAEIPVTTDNPNANLKVKDLPSGLTYDPTTKKIGGSPQLNDWDTNEETRDFTVTVEAKDPSGNTTTKTFKITVQRDTDRDGKPDVTDPDDDNDGFTDVEEKTKGTDPKNQNSKPDTGKKIDTARIAGRDRIDTAIDISKKFFKKSKAVIVVRHDLFPDSMTASVLAKLKDAPILLNPTDRLDSRVRDEIKRLGAEEVIIVGGQNSVSEKVREDLKAYDADKNVERIAGADRFGTSEMVAKRVVGITGKKNTAVVA